MTDSIQIQITKNDEVLDTSIAVLGVGPGGVPLVDLVAAAFADAYGVHAVTDPDDPDAEPVPVTA